MLMKWQNLNSRNCELYMFDFPEIAYQRQLIVASLDDFTPNAALSHVHGGQHGPNVELWKYSVVNFLWINVKCGL